MNLFSKQKVPASAKTNWSLVFSPGEFWHSSAQRLPVEGPSSPGDVTTHREQDLSPSSCSGAEHEAGSAVLKRVPHLSDIWESELAEPRWRELMSWRNAFPYF